MTLNSILSALGGGLWKILIAVAAIVFIVVFFDYLKRLVAVVEEWISDTVESFKNYLVQKREGSEGKATLPHIVLFVIAILIVIYAFGLIFGAGQSTVDLTAHNGTISLPFSNGDDASFQTDEALNAVLRVRELVSAKSEIFIGLVFGAVSVYLLIRGIKKKSKPVGLLCLGVIAAFGVFSFIHGIHLRLSATRLALNSGIAVSEYIALLRQSIDISTVSAAAKLLLTQTLLLELRWVILGCAIIIAIISGRNALSAMRTRSAIRTTAGFKGRYTRTITVAVMVVVLYVGIAVLLTGGLNILSVVTHTNGLTDALNDYGSRAAVEMEATIADADKSIAKAQEKLAEANTELEEANTALETAQAQLNQDSENADLQKAVEDAQGDVKSAEKAVKKQTKKIEKAQSEKDSALADIEAVRAAAVKYPARTKSEMFRLAHEYLEYSANYSSAEEAVAALSNDKAEEYGLSTEEFTYMASAMSKFNLNESDLTTMSHRFIYLAVGIVILAALIFFGIKMHVLTLVFKHAFLCLFAFLSVFPFYWIVVSSTNTSMDITLGKLTFGNHLLPNLINTTFDGKLMLSFGNSMKYSLCITIGSLLVSSAAGYGFVVYKSRGKDWVMKLMMLSMMVPQAATLIPLFTLFGRNNLNLLNTIWAVMLPSLATAFLIFMFRQGAQSFPRDLIEAARIDGMGEFGVFVKMFIPVMRPTYAAAATVTFMNSWNAYLWPLVSLTDNNSKTMPIYISNLLDGYVLDFGSIMLAVTISTVPTVVIFFLLQKNFVNGILGSVKQ